MAKAAYTARVTTKAHIIAGISKLNLPAVNKQYNQDAAAQFVIGLKRVLKGT